MEAFLDKLGTLMAHPVIHGIILGIAGLALVYGLAWTIFRRLKEAGYPHRAVVFSKAVAYVGTILVIFVAGDAAGLPLTSVLATAGVATVAIGFAAQNSLSNMIAGIFLLVDKPFEMGDSVELEGRRGVIERLTLLSTFMRTHDNLLVRWPNEVVMKATIINYAEFPVRRIQLRVGVAYGSNLGTARRVLLEVAGSVPSVLVDPPPELHAVQLGDNSVEYEVRAWVPQPDLPRARSELVERIHEALGEAGIEIPFPQRSVWIRGPRPADTEDGTPA